MIKAHYNHTSYKNDCLLNNYCQEFGGNDYDY